MIPPSLSSTYPHGPRLPSFKPTFYISFWFSFLLILCNILYKGLVNEPTCLFLLWPWLAFKFSSGPQTFQIKFPWGKQRFFPLQITLQGFSKSIGIPHFITLHRCSGVFLFLFFYQLKAGPFTSKKITTGFIMVVWNQGWISPYTDLVPLRL